MPTRRHFLASSLFALAPTVPEFLARTALAAPAGTDRRVLVVVQLDGGNDALNTVVPHADPEYARLRPKLKLARKDLITVTDVVGLHPALKPLDKLLTAGCLSVLPGVGYPNPNRSHFESMAIWHTAQLDPEERAAYGWIGKALDPSAGRSFVIGGAVPGALRGRRSSAISLSTINDVVLADPTAAREQAPSESVDDLLAFVRRQATDAHAAAERLAKVAGVADNASYPGTALASHLKLVARLLKADRDRESSTPSRAGTTRMPLRLLPTTPSFRSSAARWPHFLPISRPRSSPTG
jgi:uncharacterized protein (DUF1501 family)